MKQGEEETKCKSKRHHEERRQRRQEEQGQNTGQYQGKKGKHVRFGEEEHTKQSWMESTGEAEMRLDANQMKVLECGVRWAVEARRKGRGEPQ